MGNGSTRALVEAMIALLASLAQLIIPPLCSGPARVAGRVKDNYLQQLETRTRSIEAEAKKKDAEAQLAYLQAARALRSCRLQGA